MADLSGLGDLVLTVGGDITPLTSALDEIPAAAQQAAAQIQAAFDALPSATDDINASIANLSAGLSDAGAAAGEAAGHIDQMPPALHDTADAAKEAESSFKEFITTALELAGVVLSLEALKEATIGALEAFGELQRADVALTAITGDAEATKSALEGIPALADQIGASIGSLEQASVKFARFGVDLEQMPALFSSIADAAMGAGQSFDTVAAAWERVTLSGAVTNRTIMALGVSVADLAKGLGLDTTASIKDVSAAMQGLGDASDRAAVLMAAVPDSVKGLAASADTVTKAFQQMENAVTLAKEHIGQALADLGQAGGMEVLKTTIKSVETFIVSMIGFLGQAIDLVRGFGKMALDEFQAIGQAFHDATSGEWSKAIADLKAGDDKAAQDFQLMGQQMTLDWTKNGNIIDDIWNDTTSKVAASTAKIPKAMAAAAQEVIAEGLHTQQVLVQAEEGLTNSWSDLSSEFDAVTKQMNADIDLMNSGVPKSAASMNALQGMVNQLADMQSKLQNQGLLNAIQGMAAGLDLTTASAKESDATIKQFFTDIDAGSHDTVPILMATADAATKIANNVVNARKEWSTFISVAKDAASQIAAMEAGELAYGIQSQQNFDAQIRAATSLLNLMQQFNQPLAERLNLEGQILTLELKHAEAIGASGAATLQLTEQLRAVQVQQGILTEQTMGLSTLYTGMMKSFSTAWADLGKGIADSLVAGQTFGQAMMSVLQTLEKQISELVVNYLMGMLKDALLSNGELMKTFNSIFNGIFAQGGSISTGLAQTSKAFTDSSSVMVSSFGNATNAVQSGAQTMSSAMSQTATSVTNSAMTMLSGLNLIATAIGAIAGIFSAIELAHTNTLLSRIEESTRRMDIITEQNLQPDITQIRNNTSQMLQFSWGFMQPAMQQVMVKMDAVIDVLKEIDQGVWAGGGGGSTGNTRTMSALGTTLQPTLAIPQAAAMLDQAGQALQDAASQTSDAVQAMADQATQTSVAQLQLTNTATDATVHAAENLSTAAQAVTSAADAISYENLKAQDAAATQAAAAAALAASAAALTAIANRVGTGAASAMVTPFLAPQGGPLIGPPPPGGYGGFTPFVTASPNLPNVGPSGASTGGLAFANPYTYSGGNAGNSPVNINVNGSQFIQNLMNEFVQQLQTQGVRLTRG